MEKLAGSSLRSDSPCGASPQGSVVVAQRPVLSVYPSLKLVPFESGLEL